MSGAPRSATSNPGPDVLAGRRPALTDALSRLLPVVAVGTFALVVGAVLLSAGDTLGYDFRAYYDAASRALAGKPLYDASAAVAGPGGLFLYPPPLALLVLPLGLLPFGLALGVWLALLLAAFAVGTAVLPVSATTRWLVVLVAGLSWPFVYAAKLGQVGAILYLLFAVGWRWIDRPWGSGLAGALGAIVKVQPGLILVWAALTRRWAALAVGTVTLVAFAVVASVVFGLGVWGDYLALLGRVSDPITTPHNFTPGAVAYQAGVASGAASAIQLASTLAALALLLVAALRLPPVPSLLIAIVISQLVSPVLWDHYAMLLLLPVAWLGHRGRSWAFAIPLLTSVPVVGIAPPAVYPVEFWLVAAVVALEGRRV